MAIGSTYALPPSPLSVVTLAGKTTNGVGKLVANACGSSKVNVVFVFFFLKCFVVYFPRILFHL